ncbi:MAG: exodeoxyribonuclease VII large subunit [Candidatus Omnitrophica bacterium CG11_big_fil_rev_8_21_14_0_20_42_13]|uniref:Exodeoxyribonuclease 7 large subunit n=1 Tax=Candidatus Ghiorseimicrobium undicola TaxID=1974746 RepID=A0A2H0LX23_9BACT|nr:MAG: exodeoxyribonuclease VII large subunit [Candidatus Omnitrophica bacterium CG11_big_fil_rev_8_21_14_0_20_42_13]
MSKERKVLTVSQLTQDIKLILENTFSDVWVEGEISNFKAYPSGHFYFTLKDENAAINAVIFGASFNKQIKFKFENGLKVICFGRIGVYGPRSQYQIRVEKIEPKGIGSLQLAFEQLKGKLYKEGLFDEKHKKPLPLMPLRVGVVTSIKGAAVRDIISVLKRRAPFISVVIRPVKVQGEGAKEEIASAIEDFNDYAASGQDIDVLIVGRGGGSIEDLWPFNEEIVARAIFASRIPVISAVGHEIDYTISDFVADLRAPTPSAAAEIVARKKEDIVSEISRHLRIMRDYINDGINTFYQEIDEEIYNMNLGMRHQLEISRHQLKNISNKIYFLSPKNLLFQTAEKLDTFNKRIANAAANILQAKEQLYIGYLHRLNALNPLSVLERGFSLSLELYSARVIKDVKGVKIGDKIKTRLAKGSFISTVNEIENN